MSAKFCSFRLRAGISCAVFSLLGLIANQPAGAQASDSDLFLQEMPLVLTASRLVQSPLDAPAPITVIDREMIEASGFTEIHDLLRLVPGFLVADWPDSAPTIANHGLGDAHARRIEVLIDGRSINNPMWGNVLWHDLSIRSEDIEHIEVVRGPHGGAYGSNAFSGVINIITRSPLAEDGRMLISRFGRNGQRELGMRINSTPGQALDWRITASRRSEEIFRAATPRSSVKSLDRNVLNVQSNYQLSERDEIRLQFGAVSGWDRRGYPRGVNFPLHSERVHDHFLHLGWERRLAAESEIRVQYALQDRSVRSQWNVPLAGLVLPANIDYDTRRHELEFEHSFRASKPLHVLWGANLRQDGVRSQRFFAREDWINGTQWHVFGSLTWNPVEALAVNAAATFERHYYSGHLFSPRLALNYRLSPTSALRASGGRAYRAPSFMESRSLENYTHDGEIVRTFYYSPLPIQPERVNHLEIGYLARYPSLGLDLDTRAFYERYSRYVDDANCQFPPAQHRDLLLCTDRGIPPPPNYNPLGSREAYFFFNSGSFHMHGMEARADWQRPGWGRVIVSQAFINIVSNAALSDPEISSSAPASMSSILFIKDLPQRWKFSFAYYHTGKMTWLNDGDAVPSRDRYDFKLARQFGPASSDNEISFTIHSASGDYPEFSALKFRRDPAAFATLRMSW